MLWRKICQNLKNSRFFGGFCVFLLLIGLFWACDDPSNPFSNNLGEKVNVAPPTVTLDSPTVGAFLKGTVTFTGKATAYRELASVEIKIFSQDDSKGPALQEWTKKGITLVGDIKNKTWRYSLDTVDRKLEDGFLKIQFRAIDSSNIETRTVELIYIVKNKPSIVKMSNPSDAALILDDGSAKLQTGTQLGGSIIDRRGIKPGYPQIKIWKSDEDEPGDEGWGTLFLTGIDATPADAVDWDYADREAMEVVRSADFAFKLNKFQTDPVTRRIRYEEDSLPTGLWRFKIKTSETYFNETPGDGYMYPREPGEDEEELTGFYPDPEEHGIEYGTVNLVVQGIRPEIILDNSDLGPAPSNNTEADINAELAKTPNIWIDENNLPARKAVTGTGTRKAFRLRFKAAHKTENITGVTLAVSHPALGSGGVISEMVNGVITNHGMGAMVPAADYVPNDGSPDVGYVFEYYGTEQDFPSHAMPYIFTVTADANGLTTVRSFSVILSQTAPDVKINAVKGAAKETAPVPPASYYNYTVNGNIEVTGNYSANMGINKAGGQAGGLAGDKDLVKWIVETATPGADPSTLKSIDDYNANPAPAGLAFFDNLTAVSQTPAAATRGWVTETSANSFSVKFNTDNFADKTTVYLYVIAQDNVQKLGCQIIELYIDQSTDNPGTDVPGLTSATDATDPIANKTDLYIQINDQNGTQADPAKTKKNILDKNTGITLNFNDDDGIRSGDVTITLTDMNTGSVKGPFSPPPGMMPESGKELSGTLTQKMMADAMGVSGYGSYLRDGIYQLDITYKDDDAAKVRIDGVSNTVQTGNKSFIFCVINDEPKFTILHPEKDNDYVPSAPADIYGFITSYIPLQLLWISYDPQLQSPATDQLLTLYADNAYTVPATWNSDGSVLDTTTGLYTYYWQQQQVDFTKTTDTTITAEERRFNLKVYDNIGNPTGKPWSVKVDKEPPKVELDEFYFGRDLAVYKVNGKFDFIIYAEDNYGIKKTNNDVHIRWWILPDGTPPAGWGWDYTVPGGGNGLDGRFTTAQDTGGGKYRIMINSGTVGAGNSFPKLPDGKYVLYAMAEDSAGNFSRIKAGFQPSPPSPAGTYYSVGPTALQTFEIDQNADYPALDENELSPNGAAAVIKKADLEISGLITDDDGFIAANKDIYVKIRFPTANGGDDKPSGWESGWRDATATIEPGGALTFTYKVPPSMQTGTGYFADDGPKHYRIMVTDEAGNKNPAVTPATNTIINDAPIGGVSRQYPVAASPGYYSFTLKDKKPDVFFARYDQTQDTDRDPVPSPPWGGYSAARPVIKNRAELIPMLTANASPARDSFVQDGYLEYVDISYDRKTPVVLYDTKASPAVSRGTYTAPRFKWDLNSVVTGTATVADNLLTWTVSGTTHTFDGDADGLHIITVNARDLAGNTISRDWSFYKDGTGPAISFTNIEEYPHDPATVPLPAASGLSVVKIQQGVLAVTGRLADDFSYIGYANVLFDGSVTGTVDIPNVNNPQEKAKNFSIPIPDGLSDGKHRLTITAYDDIGNESKKEDMWFVVDRDNPEVTDTGGMKAGPVALNDGTGIAFPKPITDEEARVFSAAGSDITAAGTSVIFTLSGTASDANLRDISFAIRPVSSATDPVTKGSLAALLPEWSASAGTFQSGDTGQRLTVTAAAIPAAGLPAAADGTWNWTLNILGEDIYNLLHAAGYGKGVPCFITISATDLAGQNSEARHWRFYLDDEAPVITPSNFSDVSAPLPPPALQPTVFENSGDVSLIVTVSDDKRVKEIKYYISKWNYSTNAWQTWNNGVLGPVPAAGSEPWSAAAITPGSLVTWTLTGEDLRTNASAIYGGANIFLTDGQYKISIAASDYSLSQAGVSPASTKDVVFFIDREDPAVIWDDQADLRDYFRRSSADNTVTLGFTAKDLNSVPVITASIKGPIGGSPALDHGLTGAEITIGALDGDAVDGYFKTVTLNPVLPGLYSNVSGRYTITLTIIDAAGKTNPVNRDIIIDNTPPAIEINKVPGVSGSVTLGNENPLVPGDEIAVTGRLDLRGIITKTTGLSPVTFVAFYIAPGGTAPASLGLPGSDDVTIDLSANTTAGQTNRNNLYNLGWRFYDETVKDANNKPVRPVLRDGGGTNPVLARIFDGLTNVNMMIPNTSALTTAAPAPYTGGDNTTTTGVTFNGAGIPAGDAINKLRIYFLAADEAGNRNVSIYEYWVYPEGDRPTVTLSSPDEKEPVDKRLINGRFRIGGTAKDNFRIKTVWFRIMGRETSSGVYDMSLPIVNNVQITNWDDAGNPLPTYQPSGGVNLTRGSQDFGDGWFMASGGGRAEVSWYAYINSNGELDPLTEGSRPIKIEVVAEDYQYDEDGNLNATPNSGLLSKYPGKAVEARVVKGAPVFTNEEIRRAGSNAPGSYPWLSVLDANLRKRAAYRVTVTHDAGIKELTWTPPLNAGIGSTNPIDLLGSNTYTNTTYAAALGAMDAGTPAGSGIAVKAGPKNIITGTQVLASGTKYLIWQWASATAGYTGLIPGYGTEFPAGSDMRFIIITGNGTATAGANNELMAANAQGLFEWEVVIDVHGDLIDGGSYKYVDGGTGVYSGRYAVQLRATENSRTTPLYTDYKAELPIDNQPPRGVYTQNARVAGSAATLGGDAGDYAPASGVSGLDRVVMWFSRNVSGTEKPFIWDKSKKGSFADEYAAFEGNGTVPDTITGLTSAMMPKDYAETDTSGNWSSIVMKVNDQLGQKERFGHRLPIGFATTGGDLGTSWYAELDSTRIESGRITAHFIVYDKAGNASYYTQKLIVMNGVPRIARITLATDIRGDNNLTGSGDPFAVNKTYGAGRDATYLNYSNDFATTSPMAAIESKFASGTGNIQQGISDYISVNTDAVRRYGAVYDEPFNVRNNLLAIKVEVEQNKGDGGKDRKFRVEYVSRATRKYDTTNGNDFYKTIKAGRMYLIENPGNRFPWGSLGVQDVIEDAGVTYRKGTVFTAVEDGDNVVIPVVDYRLNGVAPSVWELNTGYYSDNPVPPAKPLDRPNMPAALRLNDVRYDDVLDTVTDTGKSAEFVYGAGAFTPTQFVAGSDSDTIRDFAPTIPADSDGRPAAYPALNVRANPWEAHSLFIVRVFGGDEEELFGDFVLLSIRVNNDDRTRPYAQLYDLNPKTEGQEQTQTQAQALGMNMGANRTKGGLFNTGTVRKVAKSGHIEPRATTSLTGVQMGGALSESQATITKPFLAEADKPAKLFAADTVSGDVILRGYVEDDQRIQSVRLNLGGTTVKILERNPAGFGLRAGQTAEAGVTLPAAGSVAFTETVDLYRHRVEWAYLWKTEEIPGGSNVVASNMNIRAIAYNAFNTPAASDQWTRDNAAVADTPSVLNMTRYNSFNPDYPENFLRYNQIPVNLRPYITGFRRNQSAFAHNTRSRQGWYMFARNEQVVVAGFNLANGTGTTRITVGGVAGDANTANTTALINSHQATGDNFALTNRFRVFTVGSATTGTTGDGVVTLTVNNLPAVNTGSERAKAANPATPARPNAILPWNIEFSPGTDGSELWDDFTQVHIWQSNDNTGDNGGRFASTASWSLLSPAMSINATDGTLYESHNESGSGYQVNTGTTRTTPITTTTPALNTTQVVMSFIDPIFFSDVYRSPGISGAGVVGGTGGTGAIAAGTWVASSIIGRSGSSQGWHDLGGVFVSGPGGVDLYRSGGSSYNASTYSGESTWYNASSNNTGRDKTPPTTDQFMNPHVVTSYTGTGNSTREHIHLSYYDDDTGSLKYRYNLRDRPGATGTGVDPGSNGTNVTSNNNLSKMWTNLDGGLDREDTDQTVYTHADVGTGNITAGYRVVRWDTTDTWNNTDITAQYQKTKTARGNINAGKHNSIATTSHGFPVIAYYDQTNQRLKLAVSRSASPVLASNWVIRDYVIPRDNLSSFGTGEFVSMKIDTRPGANQNRVHIAAMNTAKRLVYITGIINPAAGTTGTYGGQQDENSGSNVLTGVTVQVVDSVGNVGRWCAVSLDSDGNPWISYMDESWLGARDGAKVAFKNTTTFYKEVGKTNAKSGYIDLYGESLAGWETMHVPTLHRVENPVEGPGREHGRLGMECWPRIGVTPTTGNSGNNYNRIWSAAVGYLSQDADVGSNTAMDRYRVAYYVK